MKALADILWGQKARFSYLLLATAFLLLTLLGGKEIWTQEHRWADIVSGMFYRHDFLHPYLGENSYYDKPLLSYWLIALVSQLTGALTTAVLRIPSALAGILAIWSIYSLGSKLKNKSLGLLAGWILLTTFYFVFWARTSSADMLNLAGSLCAIAWYFNKREQAGFFDYAVFFMIVALTCLCKGLIGAVIPMLAIFTDMLLQKSWKQHFLHWPLWLGLLPALVLYLVPFWASSHFGGGAYNENGLYLVYRENVLRYFQPFDHQGPIYTYFLYLPIYLLPWAIFFIPALCMLKPRWKTMSLNAKWIAWTTLLIFLFLTLSGSRRSYYVLPLVPFAVLLTADWLLTLSLAKQKWVAGMAACSFALLFTALDIVPAWYYSQVGVDHFAGLLKQEAETIQPWGKWNIVMLDAESKLNFYLRLPPNTKNYQIKGSERDQLTAVTMLQAWPILKIKPANTIFISRKMYMSFLQGFFPGYHIVEISSSALPFMKAHDANAPVAFIPPSPG